MVICAWESTAEFHSLKQNSVAQLRMGYCNMSRLQLTVLIYAAAELKSTVNTSTSKIKRDRLINLF